MDSILNQIKSQLGDGIVDKIAKQAGTDKGSTNSVIDKALPAILGGLGKNAASKKGAGKLLEALKNKHGGDLLDHTEEKINDEEEKDGNKILGHIFGDKKDMLADAVGAKTGTSKGATSKIMAMLGPIVMANLGKSVKKKGFSLGSLTGLMGKENSKSDLLNNPMLKGMLDKNKDGSVMDDLMGMFGKKSK